MQQWNEQEYLIWNVLRDMNDLDDNYLETLRYEVEKEIEYRRKDKELKDKIIEFNIDLSNICNKLNTNRHSEIKLKLAKIKEDLLKRL